VSCSVGSFCSSASSSSSISDAASRGLSSTIGLSSGFRLRTRSYALFRCFNGRDNAIVREAYRGFVERLDGLKAIVPAAEEALTLNAKDCHDLAT
jgi:hypothetical protein